MLAGLPGFVVAFALNSALVKGLGMPKAVAYALVLVVQMTINFVICRHFVFAIRPEFKFWKAFAIFLNGVLVFRFFDWALYVLLTTRLAVPFLAAQLFNVALFSVLRFEFARGVFEGRRTKKIPAEVDTK